MSLRGKSWSNANVALHANRQDDQSAYVRHIRECLQNNAGRPSITRRAVVDAAGPPSLR